MIELRNVTKRFGEVTALDSVTLRVLKGEIFTIVGPNGSGKTTLLRIIAGIDVPTTGEIHFKGRKVSEDSLGDIRRESTMVFQRTALFNTTVWKNVSYGLKLRGLPKAEVDSKAKEALEMVKLQGYEQRLAKNLSGGEQQRVSLARALALNTDVLALDEPTANLDPRNVSIIEETISRVNRERGATVIIATHNMLQAENLTNRAALLTNGRIAQTGPPQEIFRAPSDHLSGFARLENVFSGSSMVSEDGVSLIDLENGVKIEATMQKTGRVTVFVRPEDIILSKEKIVSSARNMFAGEVTEVTDFGSTVELRVNAGKEFVVQITKKSFKEMQLNIGSHVCLAFKASSVRVV